MSVNRIEDNVQLKNVLESNSRIVFLCGAGASMSLGSHGLNWSKWLLQSKSFLSDAEKSKLDNLMGNYSSDELIDAATFVIETLKNGGNYNTFMDTTIGRLHPSDKEFSQALCNIWRTGDIIATTNYDLQLEEAVGAQGVSYSTPDKTLCVVRGLSDNRIIHLHGMYDNIHGIDDIIADSRQYDAILKDEGAQFVQNLIGTHAIILVGCGATVEDPNLSGFMNFLTDKIGILNIPYFYIMREGDDIPELPTNAVPVYYGTEYNDLPVFMKQLSVYRLISRLYLINGLISVNPYKNNSTVMSAFGRMHFSSGFNPFTGRDDEMSRLSSFIQCSDKYKWWVITGKGGIGKSRLVLEWLRTMKSDWVGFFVNKEAKSLINFEPFTNTVFVVDYIVGYEDKVASLIEILDNIICSSQYRLRLLFIERNQEEAEDHW